MMTFGKSLPHTILTGSVDQFCHIWSSFVVLHALGIKMTENQNCLTIIVKVSKIRLWNPL